MENEIAAAQSVPVVATLKKIRVQCAGPGFLKHLSRMRNGLDETASNASSDEVVSDDKFDIDIDITYLRSLDPKEWKDQDHYHVLGIKKLRFNATEDEIRRAYRKIVIKHHPDKRKAQGEEIKSEDDYFTCITKAYETLGVQAKRRSYDSIDPEFDDSLPTTAQIEKNFYSVFQKFFQLNSRWSEKKNVPVIGNAESSRQDVDNFYNFWYEFESWREYSYLDEEDKDKGQDREERRWIEKQNRTIRIKRKKEEMSRIRQLVDLAYNNDPRIVKFRNDDKERKLAAKRAKMSVAQAARAEEERLVREALVAKKEAEAAEQKRIEQIRQEKEQQKRALKKERKLLRDTAKEASYYSTSDKEKVRNMEGVEKICEMLKFLELQAFNKTLATGGRDAFTAQLKETEAQLEAERKALFEPTPVVAPVAKVASTVVAVEKNSLWTPENMQLLIKAVNLFPAGTVQRWEVTANYINQHATNLGNRKFMSRDVLNKAKDLQNSDFAKNTLKEQANDDAFASFQKSKKDLKIIDPTDISVNADAPVVSDAPVAAAKPEAPVRPLSKPTAPAPDLSNNKEAEAPQKKEKKAPKPKQNGVSSDSTPTSKTPAPAPVLNNNNNTNGTSKTAAAKNSKNSKTNNNNNAATEPTKKDGAAPKEVKVNGVAHAEPAIVTNGTTEASSGGAGGKPSTWTKDEQALLEQAIKTYPISTADRWERIAECIPNRTKKECLRRVKELVDRVSAKREAQLVFSTLYEVLVDFTRDYEAIKQAIAKIEHYDKTCMENMLQAVKSILLSNWGSQNHSQVLVFTDCGIGFGPKSLRTTIATLRNQRDTNGTVGTPTTMCLPFTFTSKLSFMCIGQPEDPYFRGALVLFQELLDVSGQKGELFVPADIGSGDNSTCSDATKKLISLSASVLRKLVTRMCETNYKPFEAMLKCGGYARLECAVSIWPPPTVYVDPNTGTNRQIKRSVEICGYLALADIGSPMSISRHLLMPRNPTAVSSASSHSKFRNSTAVSTAGGPDCSSASGIVDFDHETLESDLKAFYSKPENTNSDDECIMVPTVDHSTAESVCVLLHGALKMENLAAMVSLADDWFGFIFSYADSKKKSNLMLTILPPGHDVVPWLGDLRFIATVDDLATGEIIPTFPVKPDKRSYSQNCVVWIKSAGLQADIQKVLRHAKKLPDKTPSFYKELNRICKAALAMGFVELLEGLANVFEREMTQLPHASNVDCTMQLQHTSSELRKLALGEGKMPIVAYPTKFNPVHG